MSPRALIIEDDPATAESMADMLEVLEHEYEAVGDMKAARERLAGTVFDYLILDMAIPVAPGKLPNREVGRQLLGEIRARSETAMLPTLVVTGEDQGESEFIQSVLRTGGYDTPLLAYMQKRSLTYETMSRKLQSLLSGQPGVTPPAPPQKPITAFSAQTRQVTIYRHRIDVCGVQLWGETESPDMRTAMLNLNRKDATGRYIALRGAALVPERNASNKVGALIERFRKNATRRLREDRDLECGAHDIIGMERRKGYFLREWVVVEEVDAEGPDDPAQATAVLCHKGGLGTESASALNQAPATGSAAHESQPFSPTERQRDILGLLALAPMAQKELLAKIKVGKSTLNRDLAPMRDAELFRTDGDKRYTLTDAGRAWLE